MSRKMYLKNGVAIATTTILLLVVNGAFVSGQGLDFENADLREQVPNELQEIIREALSPAPYFFQPEKPSMLLGNRRGRETYLRGRVGTPRLLSYTTVEEGGRSLDVVLIRLPIDGTYQRKYYIGLGSEYKYETWPVAFDLEIHVDAGKYRAPRVRSSELKNVQYNGSHAGHDSHQMTFHKIVDTISQKLSNL